MRPIIDVSGVARITVLMRRPRVATHLALVGLYVAPRQFAIVKDAVYRSPRAAAAPTVDGEATDDCWQHASPVALQDECLNTPPLRGAAMRVVSANGRLYFLIESSTAGCALHASGKDEPLWQLRDDTVEVLLYSPTDGASLMLVANSTDRCASNVFAADGSQRACKELRVASRVHDGKWRLEIGLDPRVLGENVETLGMNVRRRDKQIGPLVWAKDPALPTGVEALGTLDTSTD